MAALLLIASLIHIGRSHKFDYDARIVNGLPISADKYPWMVSLRREIERSGNIYSWSTCGASLIGLSPPIILTAAHCIDFYTYNSTDMTVRDSLNRINYLYADINRTYPAPYVSSSDIYYTIPISVDDMYIHPLWNNSGSIDNIYDIALLIFTDFNDSQSDLDTKFEALLPTILESNNYDDNTQCCDSGEELTAIGYGDTATGGPSSYVLRTTTLEYVDKVDCMDAVADALIPDNYNDTLPPNITSIEELKQLLKDEYLPSINSGSTVCVVGNNTDICEGDSGGPLFRINQQDQVEVIGVTSYGVGDCNDGVPSGYTNVASYYDWIIKVIAFVVDGESYDPTMDPTSDPSQMPSESSIMVNAAYSINLVHIYVFIVYFTYWMV